MKKHQAVVMLLIFLFAWVVFSQDEVKAQGTIYINEDGSVEGTDKIQLNKNVYTLTEDINGTISVLKDDVILDGAGHIVRGQANGVVVLHRNNVTIENFVVTTNSTSDNIYVYNCTNCTILNNAITPFTEKYPGTGVSVWGGSSNVIAGNQIMNNLCGIFLGEATSNNHITGNIITNNTRGVQIQNSQNTSIYNNNFNNRLFDVQIVGDPPENSMVINFDNGTWGNYWRNYSGTDADEDGIGDTPYIIDDNYSDTYPLMESVTVIPEFSSLFIVFTGLLVVTLLSTRYKRRFKQGKKG